MVGGVFHVMGLLSPVIKVTAGEIHFKGMDILAARELRQVRADTLDCFDPPREPLILPRPTCQFCHLYVWQNGTWIELDPATHAPEGAAP